MNFPFILNYNKGTLEVTKSQTFDSLKESMVAADGDSIKDIKFFDAENNRISSSETIGNWDSLPIVMRVYKADDSKLVYSLNFNLDFKLNQRQQVKDAADFNDLSALSKEEVYLTYCQDLGMDKNQSLFLANYARKL